MATEVELAKTGSTPGRIRTEPCYLPPFDLSDGNVVAPVACTAVVKESRVAKIAVDSIEGVAVEGTSDVVGVASASTKTAAAELVIAIDAVVADKSGIDVAVVPVAVVETAHMTGSAGQARRGKSRRGGNILLPDDTMLKGGWGVMMFPEVEAGEWNIVAGACDRVPR